MGTLGLLFALVVAVLGVGVFLGLMALIVWALNRRS